MKKVTLKMNVQTAAVVRQVLFEAQKGYSYDHVPARIVDIRQVIVDIDESIGSVVESD